MLWLKSSVALTIVFATSLVQSSYAQNVTADASSGCNGATIGYSVHNYDNTIPSGLYATVSANGTASGQLSLTGDLDVTWIGNGTVTFYWNGNSLGTSKSFTVSNPLTVNQAYQCGTTPFALSASIPAGGSITWQSSTDHSNWTTVSNPTSVTITGPTFFRANYTKSGCSTVTDEMDNRATILSAGTVEGVFSSVCSGDYADLTYAGGSTSPPPSSVTYEYCAGTSCSSWTTVSNPHVTNITQAMTFRAVFHFPCGLLYSAPKSITTINSAPPVPQVGFPTTVCTGNTTTIHIQSISNGLTYSLQDPTYDTGQSIQGNSTNNGQSWDATVGPGSYRIKVTDSHFCSSFVPASGSATITQKNPLDATQVFIESTTHSQPVSVCEGVSVGLQTRNLTGSTWYSSPSGALNTSGETATFKSTNPEGTYTIYASGQETNCFQGRTTANYTVVVKHTPQAYADPFNAVCSGTLIHIPLEVYGNYPTTTYTWTVTPGAGATNSVTPAADGSEIAQTLIANTSVVNVTYVITPTLNGCSGPPLNVTIPVNPAPVLSVSDEKMFSSYDVSLPLNSSIPGATVAWTVSNQVNMEPVANGTTTASVLSQVVKTSPSTSDGSFTYTLTPTYNGCAGPVKTVNMTVFFLPVVTFSINPIIKGDDRFSAVSTIPPFGTGTWYLDGSSLDITTQSFTTRTPGWYKVLVTREGVSAFTDAKELVLGLSDQNLNYIITDVVQKPGITVGGLPVSLMSNDKVNQGIKYFDDLGRPMENVVTQGSPTGLDIISPSFYNPFSNETVKVLPITGDKRGAYQNVLEEDGTYKQIGDDFYNSASTPPGVTKDYNPYSTIVYDASPLNRVIDEKPVGNAWYAHSWTTDKQYTTNALPPVNDPTDKTFAVYLFTIVDGALTLSSGTYYPIHTLFLERVFDSSGHETMEFKDKDGRLVCRKVKGDAPKEYAATHYVYDVNGDLVAVVPPQALVEMGL
jgi:hypothetical protein